MKSEESRRGGGMKESQSCKPGGFWTWCSIMAALIALWLGGAADESDSLPQWVTLLPDADGIVIVCCCSQLYGTATECDHSSLNLWGTRRCFLILSVPPHHISVGSQLQHLVLPAWTHWIEPWLTPVQDESCRPDEAPLGEIIPAVIFSFNFVNPQM